MDAPTPGQPGEMKVGERRKGQRRKQGKGRVSGSGSASASGNASDNAGNTRESRGLAEIPFPGKRRLSVCPSASLPDSPPARLPVRQTASVCLPVCQSARLSDCPSASLPVCSLVNPPVCLSDCQFVCSSVRLCICLCTSVFLLETGFSRFRVLP